MSDTTSVCGAEPIDTASPLHKYHGHDATGTEVRRSKSTTDFGPSRQDATKSMSLSGRTQTLLLYRGKMNSVVTMVQKPPVVIILTSQPAMVSRAMILLP